jgi:hypothetical protein
MNKDEPRGLKSYAPAIVAISVDSIAIAIFITQFQSVSSLNVTGEVSSMKYSDGIT